MSSTGKVITGPVSGASRRSTNRSARSPASSLILHLTSRAPAAGPGLVDRSDAACQAAVTTATYATSAGHV
jgi:hypothetical protein